MNYQVIVSDVLSSFRMEYATLNFQAQRQAVGLATFSSTATSNSRVINCQT